MVRVHVSSWCAVPAVCVAVVLAGCQQSEPGRQVTTTAEAPPPTEVPSPTEAPGTPQPVPQPPTTTRAPLTPEPPVPARQWTMPNLVGSTLQQAQDKIQVLTDGVIFFTDSHDATGRNRSQILDANWKVCSQNVSAGAPINADTKIDFGVVNLAEPCP